MYPQPHSIATAFIWAAHVITQKNHEFMQNGIEIQKIQKVLLKIVDRQRYDNRQKVWSYEVAT